MSYIYTFLGVTAWVLTVSLSSGALVSYDNSKHTDYIQKQIETTTRNMVGLQNNTVTQVEKMTTPQVVSVSQEITPKSVIAQTPVKKPKVVVHTIKKITPKPVQRYHEEEEGNDD